MQLCRATLLHTRATKSREKIAGVTSHLAFSNVQSPECRLVRVSRGSVWLHSFLFIINQSLCQSVQTMHQLKYCFIFWLQLLVKFPSIGELPIKCLCPARPGPARLAGGKARAQVWFILTRHCTSGPACLCLLLTQQAACRAASEHVTGHVSNNWPAREVCSVFYFPTADSLKRNEFDELIYQNGSSYAYTTYISVCSRYCRTLGYVDRQRAVVIYNAITYSKHRYENSNMALPKIPRDIIFAQTRISLRGSLSTTKKFCRPLGWYFTPFWAARMICPHCQIYSIFGTMPRGLWGIQPVVAQNLVSHIMWQSSLKFSAH